MARFSISLLIFGILGSAYGQVTDYPCEMLAFRKCNEPWTEASIRRFNLFHGEAFLKENCEAVIEQLDCLLEEEKTCPLPMLFMWPEERFRGLLSLKQLADDICDEDSSLRKDYVQIVDCLSGHENDVIQDIKEFIPVLALFHQHPDIEEMSVETLKCIELSFIFNEFKNSVGDHCGPLAQKTVDTILNYAVAIEPDHCLVDQENIERLTELLQSMKPSRENLIQRF